MGIIIKDMETTMSEIRQLISEGKTVTIAAKGYSMNPFIVHLKDKITLGPCNDDQIRKGAVVLARDSRGRFVIHRIIKREGDIITLRGDGNYLRTIEKARVSDVIALMYSVTKKRRTYSVQSLRWRLYSCLWRLITPVRRYPLALWRKFHRQEPLR